MCYYATLSVIFNLKIKYANTRVNLIIELEGLDVNIIAAVNFYLNNEIRGEISYL